MGGEKTRQRGLRRILVALPQKAKQMDLRLGSARKQISPFGTSQGVLALRVIDTLADSKSLMCVHF